MLKTFASPRLRLLWLGRLSHSTPPKLAFALRRDLALLHAAINIDDLRQACGDRLQPMIDESIPFDDPAPDPAHDPDLGPDLDPDLDLDRALDPDAGSDGDANPHHDRYTLRVGYGWWLLFRFTRGEALGVALDEAPGP